jgi:hypothetical protein
MYSKIAEVANRDFGCIDLSCDDVERYLRFADTTYITMDEVYIIEDLLERFI